MNIRNYFLYLFSAVNIAGLALLGAAFHQGWLTAIWEADTSRITSVIGATFLLGMIVSCWKAYGINDTRNRVSAARTVSSYLFGFRNKDALGLSMSADIAIVQHIATILLLLGISGTMIGIILALKSVEAFSIGDQANMVAAIIMLFKGVYVKFYASLVGITGHMWLLTNYNMLATESRRLLARIINV